MTTAAIVYSLKDGWLTGWKKLEEVRYVFRFLPTSFCFACIIYFLFQPGLGLVLSTN